MTPSYLPLLGLLHISVKPTWNLIPGNGLVHLPSPEFPVLCDLQIMDKDVKKHNSPDTSKAPNGSSLSSCFFQPAFYTCQDTIPHSHWNGFLKNILHVKCCQCHQLEPCSCLWYVGTSRVWFLPSLLPSIPFPFLPSMIFYVLGTVTALS